MPPQHADGSRGW